MSSLMGWNPQVSGEKYSLQYWCIQQCWLGMAGCQGRQEDHLLWIGGPQHPLLPITRQGHSCYTTCIWMRDIFPCLLLIERVSVFSPRTQAGRQTEVSQIRRRYWWFLRQICRQQPFVLDGVISITPAGFVGNCGTARLIISVIIVVICFNFNT